MNKVVKVFVVVAMLLTFLVIEDSVFSQSNVGPKISELKVMPIEGPGRYMLLYNVVVTDNKDINLKDKLEVRLLSNDSFYSLEKTSNGNVILNVKNNYGNLSSKEVLVEYKVSDSDGNTTKAIRTLLFDFENRYSVGDKYTIKSKKSLSATIEEYNNKASYILGKLDVEVFDAYTWEKVDVNIDVNTFDYLKAVGNYKITVSVPTDYSTRMDIDAVVSKELENSLLFENSVEVEWLPILPIDNKTSLFDEVDTFEKVDVTIIEESNKGLFKIIGKDLDQVIEIDNNYNSANYGEYAILEYSVIDFNGNDTTYIRKIIYDNPNYYSIGEQFTIYAKDYMECSYDYNNDASVILNKANAYVLDSKTGEKLNTNINVDASEYFNAIGLYKVFLTIDEDLSITNKLIIALGEPSNLTLNVEKFSEVVVGETLDLRANLIAKNFNGEDLVDDVVVEPATIDTSKHGVYPINYSLSHGDDFVTFTRVVVVTNGNYYYNDLREDVNTPILYAEDFNVDADTVINEEVVKELANLKVYSSLTGLKVNGPLVEVNLSDYKPGVHAYGIEFVAYSYFGDVPSFIVNNNLEFATYGKAVVRVEDYTKTVNPIQFEGLDPMVVKDSKSYALFDGVSVNDDTNDIKVEVLDFSNDYEVIIEDGFLKVLFDNKLVTDIVRLQYSVEDSFGNTTVAIRRVLLSNASIVNISDKYIISANNFDEFLYQYDNSKEHLLESANLKVFDVNLFAEVDVDIVVDTSNYVSKLGVSTVKFYLADDLSIFVEVDVNVRKLATSFLDIERFSEIEVGNNFDLYEGIEARDVDGSDLSSTVVVSPPVIDTSKHGINVINYTFIDKSGNVYEKSRTVLVNNGNYAYNGYQDLIVYAEDFVMDYENIFTTTESLLIGANVSVYFGNEWEKLENPIIDYSVKDYENSRDGYTITFKVSSAKVNPFVKLDSKLKATKSVVARPVNKNELENGKMLLP